MRTVCSWCQKTIGVDDLAPEDAVTHGICLSCSREFFAASETMPMQDFLDRILQPVLFVGEGGLVEYANLAARKMSGMSRDEVAGRPGGDVIECIHAHEPGGCGRTAHCDGCAIRRAVTETLADGQGRRNVEAYRDVLTPGGVVRKRFLLNTEYVDGVVMVRFDEVQSVPASV